MPSFPILFFMVIFSLVSLAAVLQNGFMVTFLGREWLRCGTLPAGDMMVACLVTSRLCLHGISILNNLVNFFGFCYRTRYLDIFWDFVNTLTFWLTAWLSVFYCLKISTFAHPVFFWLKWRISRSVPRLLLSALFFGVLSATSTAVGNAVTIQTITSESVHGNCTLSHSIITFHRWYFFWHSLMMWLTPLLLFLGSIILLMFSLYRHMEQMRGCMLGPCDSSTQAHTVALRSLSFFFIFYVLHVLTQFISRVQLITIWNPWYWVKETVLYAGIFLHSMVLLLSSPKLRKVLKTWFSDLCCL
ncbi:taste receptor type 2 member 143-like [Cavia porcellus]|uniref:taste receptor type 2 member 143-like n=1 Tax=Cavia porcellus TaxID=10141 RepID=UPI00022B79EB|nr:taste receptor type 2 member 143-like [Cavia porcellus]